MSASSDRERVPQRQLGELMTGLGLITEEQLATVLEVQQRSKRPLGQIIVELGFASGAAVAHALAMQSGGALKTEYGFALGVHPDEESDADGDDETATGLPKLRLASGAVAPPVRETVPLVEDDGTETEAVEEPAALAALPAPVAEPDAVVEAVEAEELEQLDEAGAVHEAEVDEVDEVEEPEPSEEVVEVEPADEELPVAEPVEVVPEDVETPAEEAILAEELEPVVETDAAELLELRAEVERLETALAEAESAAAGDQERLRADVAKLESLLAETHETNEKRLSELWEERDNATTEIERLQTTLADAQGEREQELTRLREEH